MLSISASAPQATRPEPSAVCGSVERQLDWRWRWSKQPGADDYSCQGERFFSEKNSIGLGTKIGFVASSPDNDPETIRYIETSLFLIHRSHRAIGIKKYKEVLTALFTGSALPMPKGFLNQLDKRKSTEYPMQYGLVRVLFTPVQPGGAVKANYTVNVSFDEAKTRK